MLTSRNQMTDDTQATRMELSMKRSHLTLALFLLSMFGLVAMAPASERDNSHSSHGSQGASSSHDSHGSGGASSGSISLIDKVRLVPQLTIVSPPKPEFDYLYGILPSFPSR